MLLFYISLLEAEEDKKRMAELYEEYRYFSVFVAKKILGNQSDAEDAAHAAFLEVIKNKEKYFAMNSNIFRPFFVVIVKNKAIDILRKKKSEDFFGDDPFDKLSDEMSDVGEMIAQQDEYARLRQAIKKLKPSYAQVLTMRYFEDKSYAEIAEELNKSTGYVGGLLSRATESLRKEIGRLEESDEPVEL